MPKKIADTKKMTHEQWLELRKSSVGGSESATCVNMNPWDSLISLYSRKKGLSKEKETSEAMRLGTDLEAYVAERFTEQTGKKVRNDFAMYADDEYEFLTANIDRRVVGENAGLECKTMGSFNGYNLEAGEVPSHYYCQCQHYCMVMGFDMMYLAVLVLQRGLYVVEIKRDDDFIKDMKAQEVDFWLNYVCQDRIPAPDGSEASLETLKELYPDARKDTEMQIAGLDTMVRDYKAFDELAKQYTEKKEKIKAQICARLGNYEIGIGDEVGVSWKNQSRMKVDEKLLKAEMPAIYAAYAKPSNYRVFRTKKLGGKKDGK